MNAGTAIGTIDHPLTRDPRKQAPMTVFAEQASAADTRTRLVRAAGTAKNRNRDMQLIQEALARAHMRQPHGQAPDKGPEGRRSPVRRMRHQAERASLRARRALARAVL